MHAAFKTIRMASEGELLSDLSRAISVHSAHERPFVLLTWAQSLDGKIASAPGTRTTISGALSMTLTHQLRGLCDGILVGVGTVVADNPRLSCRTRGGASPRVVILDSCLRTPPASKCLVQEGGRASPLIMCAQGADELSHCGVADIRYVEKDTVGIKLKSVLSILSAEGIQSVMVEGGNAVLSSFLEQGLYDFVIVTVAPVLFGDGVPAFRRESTMSNVVARPAFSFPRIESPKWSTFGDDVVLSGRPKRR